MRPDHKLDLLLRLPLALLLAGWIVALPLNAGQAQRLSLQDILDRVEALEESVLAIGPGANLVGQDLTGVGLAGRDLRGLRAMEASGFEDLTDTNLAFADLRGADMTGAIPCRTDFSYADLTGILADWDFGACEPGPIATVNQFTTCTDGLPLGGRSSLECLGITESGPVLANSGTYLVIPPVLYLCTFLGTPVVIVNIDRFEFVVNGDIVTVFGAPADMQGTAGSSSFSVTGTIPGTVDEVYLLTGTFSDADTWTGTFNLSFVGDISGTTCSNQSINMTGNRQ